MLRGEGLVKPKAQNGNPTISIGNQLPMLFPLSHPSSAMALHLCPMRFPGSPPSPPAGVRKLTSRLNTSAKIRAWPAVTGRYVFHRGAISANAVKQGRQDGPSDEPETAESPPAEPRAAELSELGSEIKKAMKDKEESGKEANFWSGVVEEIGEIEWPEFGKVLGTTWVVLGVIAGSSVALLTVNAVLAELSDRVFAGKGIQDFFG